MEGIPPSHLPCAVLPAKSNAKDVYVTDTLSPLPESKDETSPQTFSMFLCFCSLIKCKLHLSFEKKQALHPKVIGYEHDTEDLCIDFSDPCSTVYAGKTSWKHILFSVELVRTALF